MAAYLLDTVVQMFYIYLKFSRRLLSVLNFKEISPANRATGEQDEFELFSRDFFEFLGYQIIQAPNRGSDGGIDLLVEEERRGVGGVTKVRWLVSCKHYVHSGKAVGVDDEVNIGDRVNSHQCDGFIGFYSTLPSSGLSERLKGWSARCNSEFKIFDRGEIEKSLLNKPEGIILATRYFPLSMKSWIESKNNLAQILTYQEELSAIRKRYYEDYIKRKRNKEN